MKRLRHRTHTLSRLRGAALVCVGGASRYVAPEKTCFESTSTPMLVYILLASVWKEARGQKRKEKKQKEAIGWQPGPEESDTTRYDMT